MRCIYLLTYLQSSYRSQAVQSAVVAAVDASNAADCDVTLTANDSCSRPVAASLPATGVVMRTGRQLPAIPTTNNGIDKTDNTRFAMNSYCLEKLVK